MGRVFVVQEPMMRDRFSGKARPKFDLSPAREFGEINYLLRWSDSTEDLGSVVWFLRDKLRDFGDEDCLLMTGDPNAMAMASCLAMEANGGRARLLSWDSAQRRYRVSAVDMNAQPPIPVA